jgi:hypothetical protein
MKRLIVALFILTLSLAFVSAEESFQISTGTNNLELGESLGSIVNSIGSEELDLLADGNISNTFGTVEYTQQLSFPEEGSYVTFTEDEDDTTADFLYFPDNEIIATYELSFSDTFKSGLEGTELVDFEGKTLYFMGKPYTFFNAIKVSNLVKFNFVSGDETLSINDDDFTTDYSGRLEVNGNIIDEAEVNFKANMVGELFYLSGITIEMVADDDYYVPAGGKLSENNELYEPELLFTQMWDISYAGLSEEETHEIKIRNSGGDRYELDFYDANNYLTHLPIAYVSDSGELNFGKKTGDDLVLDETKPITDDDFFVLTVEGKSHVMQYRGADSVDDIDSKIKLRNLGTGETYERSLASDGIFDLKLGGHTFNIKNASSMESDNFNISIDLNGDGDFDDSGNILIYDHFGAEIMIEESEDEINFALHTPFYDFEDVEPTDIEYKIVVEGDELNLIKKDNIVLKQPDNIDDYEYGYTPYGTFINYSDISESPRELTLSYPYEQRFAQVSILGYESEVQDEENNSSDDSGNDSSGDSNDDSEDDDLSGFVFPTYNSDALSINLYAINQFAAPDNTYENGWQFRFLVSFPENEAQISLWVDDWKNANGDILNTAENTKLVYSGNDYLVGSEPDYSESDSFIVKDEFPSYPGIQAHFDLLVKIPEDFAGGLFSTTYGLKSLPEE